MSNIFGKQLLKDLLSNTASTESSFTLPRYVTINEKKLNDSITSSFVQNGGSNRYSYGCSIFKAY